MVLPSSHSSPAAVLRMVSPQRGRVQFELQPAVCPPREPGSHCSVRLPRVCTWPSPQNESLQATQSPLSSVLPSSHSSTNRVPLRSWWPSPQKASLQSTQSSSSRWLPSSHCSPAVRLTVPSPQKTFVQSASQVLLSPPSSHFSAPPVWSWICLSPQKASLQATQPSRTLPLRSS